MSGHAGFEADLGTLKEIANKTLPHVANAISTAASPLPNLSNSPAAVFGSTHGGGAMGAAYNQVLDALSAALTAFSGSVDSAAGRLHGIAENYQKIDDSLAGK